MGYPKLFIHDPSRSLGNTAPVLFEKRLGYIIVQWRVKIGQNHLLGILTHMIKGILGKPKPFSLQGENLLFGTKILN